MQENLNAGKNFRMNEVEYCDIVKNQNEKTFFNLLI
jgi:hypothetical protein